MSKLNAIQFNKVCRTCLTPSTDMKPLFEANSRSTLICFAELLMTFTPLQCFSSDGLPTQICRNCIRELSRLNAFRSKCLESDAKLRSYLDTTVKTDETNIVEEEVFVKSESAVIVPNNRLHHSDITTDPIDVIRSHFENKSIDHIEEVFIKSEFPVTLESSTRFEENPNPNILTFQTQDIVQQSNITTNTLKDPLAITKIQEIIHEELDVVKHAVNDDVNVEKKRIKVNDAPAKEKPYLCPLCENAYTSKQSLTIHMRMHTGEKPYPCTVCNSSFRQKYSLTYHMRTHTDQKPYACTVCDTSFNTKQHLAYHMQTHTGDKPYACTICDNSFITKQHFTHHMRTHTGERPYSCTVCESSFGVKQNLKDHMRTHSDVKPYACTMCSMSFRQRYSLKLHMRTHTGEKPYTCTICNISWGQPERLKYHMRNHTGAKPYPCTVCDSTFSHKQHLKAHVRTHTT